VELPIHTSVTRPAAYRSGMATAKLALSSMAGSIALRSRTGSEAITRNMTYQAKVTPKKP
jgi:hypothetical protein